MEKRILISRWFGPDTQPIPIYDEASVSAARQRVRDTARPENFTQEVVESAALIASELTHNHRAHALQGYFAVRVIERGGLKGLEVIAADLGPGIEKPAQALRGEIRSEGSLGAGLHGVCRMADEVEFDNRLSEGVCIVARKFAAVPASLCCDVAIMSRPLPGETISGDDALFFQNESGFMAVVADGLGHGHEAREAANQAVLTVSRRRGLELEDIMVQLNTDLAGTRGCVMSIVRFDRATRMMECASVGDMHTHVYHRREAYLVTATPMALGTGVLQKRRIRVERVAVEPGSILISFTDGLKSRTNLKGQLDLLRQPVITVAQHLLENYSRPDDDALALVARFLS
jgi:anti-sigma regulatory factor (Ser/Thr protein kinase)